jgi:hypothetical protein
MPKDSDPLKEEEIKTIRDWIVAGGDWPENVVIEPLQVTDKEWWSLRPLTRPVVPQVALLVRGADGMTTAATDVPHNEIDAFIAEKHRQLGLSFAVDASRATLIRRLSFDLLGLPPTPEQIERFVNDPAPDAYEKLVDLFLASPQYGERWGRHWLDIVHYGDTHGYDKDQPRPNAWPYRDYVIRALNDDKPWSCFVEEQVAGDVLFPGTRDGIEALGFIAAGPWDQIGHAEVPESKYDGKVARHLDRDDMVRNTIQTFNSLTIGCAQCHNHKFDPITQADYYSLQAVFAAVDRADKAYDTDPTVATRRQTLDTQRRQLAGRQQEIERHVHERAGQTLANVESAIEQLEQQRTAVGDANPTSSYGYHSEISPQQDSVKWVQVDLGSRITMERVVLRPAFDNFNGIGAGFGFPARLRVEASDDPEFQGARTVFAAHESEDVSNPGLTPFACEAPAVTARYVRVTATKLAARQNDFIFALAELQVIDPAGENRARGAVVTAFDSIEAPPRWGRANLVDGHQPQAADDNKLQELRQQREQLWQSHLTDAERDELSELTRQQAEIDGEWRALPTLRLVYAGTVYQGTGSFVGTGASGGKPRTIHLLNRGDVAKPGAEAGPGALAVFDQLPSRFDLPPDRPEGERRAALARWLTSRDNHLTWRSIVNRVWQYHFGRGFVDTPNDFGHMGARPTHPELLDWLAAEFRDGGQSLKTLHRRIVTSHTYRQASTVEDASQPAVAQALAVDAENQFLWRMMRRKLEAEAVRDSVLLVSGQLDSTMGGPAFQDFVVEKPEHSPHYQFHLHDPDDPACHRRSVYRFIVRSQLQPFMAALDCADPSLQVGRRNESLTPLQALAMLNDGIVVTMSKHLAAKLDSAGGELRDKVQRGFCEAIGRHPSTSELDRLVAFAEQYGLANYCRLLFNLNEFTFVD